MVLLCLEKIPSSYLLRKKIVQALYSYDYLPDLRVISANVWNQTSHKLTTTKVQVAPKIPANFSGTFAVELPIIEIPHQEYLPACSLAPLLSPSPPLSHLSILGHQTILVRSKSGHLHGGTS